jgi:hypothetical protein
MLKEILEISMIFFSLCGFIIILQGINLLWKSYLRTKELTPLYFIVMIIFILIVGILLILKRAGFNV